MNEKDIMLRQVKALESIAASLERLSEREVTDAEIIRDAFDQWWEDSRK